MPRLPLLLAALCALAAFAHADDRPNVLFIALDDLNALAHTPQARTPALDRLAARGVRFTRAYCPAPTCCPSRASLMCGYRPSTTGVYNNDDDWRKAIPEPFMLTATFRRYGYFVGGAGKIYHDSLRRPVEWNSYRPKTPGDDPEPKRKPGVKGLEFGPVDAPETDWEDSQTVSWIIDQIKAPHDRPFFLACGLHKPHLPWCVPQKYFDLFPLESIELPRVLDTDLEDVPAPGRVLASPAGEDAALRAAGKSKEAVQAYLASVAFADAQIGRLLDALDASPVAAKTIVVLWGDHGFHLGEKLHWGKHALWEEATHTTMIWMVPGLTPAGKECARTVDLTCLFPTLTELCRVPTPAHCEGFSIRSLLAQPDAPWPHPAITTWGQGNTAIRTEQWRYIRYADGTAELYDHEKDPLEWTNLAGKLPDIETALAKEIPEVSAVEMAGVPVGEPEKKKKKKK